MDLEALYDRFETRLYRHALAMTRHGADAEDVLQTVFAKVARRLKKNTRIDDMEAYLHTAVRREALRLLARRPTTTAEFSLVAPRNGLSPEDAEHVNAALGKLPPEQREVVLLHVYEDLTFRRIGKLLGVSPDTVASRYRYARTKLKEWLRDD